MSDFTYTRGNWTNGFELVDWRSEEPFEKWLSSNDFEPIPFYELPDDDALRIYRSFKSGRFLVELCLDRSHFDIIVLADLPSLIQFTKEVEPTIKLLSEEKSPRP